MTEHNNIQLRAVDQETAHIRNLLQRIKHGAEECAAELGLPKQAGYDILAVLHGQAFMDEREAIASQEDHYPLSAMSLMILAERSAQEINKYQHNELSDERYCLEIFRRAVTLQDHEAWATLQRQFTKNVRFWLSRHACKEAALRYESEQDYIDHAFQRFWQATSDQALTFTSLASALRYLRLCLHCAIMDTLRAYAHSQLEALPEQGSPEESQVEDHYNKNELWEIINSLLTNDRERRVAYLHFHCNLKPREIMRYCPGEFASESEIYRIKRNVMERIMRNIDKIRWRLGGDPLS